MNLLGIDPGQTGGLAMVKLPSTGGPAIVAGLRMPVIKMGRATVVDIVKVEQFLMHDCGNAIYDDKVTTILEKVHAMPGRDGRTQGTVSAFQFGRSFGAVEAFAKLHTDRVVYAPPATWKRDMELKGGRDNKDASIALAKELFGDSYVWKYKADNGIAEAALMALWASQHRRPL